jgi:hypothetical protein
MNQLSTTKELFNGTTATPAFVDLDNEPDLWDSTHLEVQGPTEITPSAYIAKTLSVTEALKTQFPDMVIFGPSHYGFLGIYSWQGGVTGATPTGENWFPDEYFQAWPPLPRRLESRWWILRLPLVSGGLRCGRHAGYQP